MIEIENIKLKKTLFCQKNESFKIIKKLKNVQFRSITFKKGSFDLPL